MNDAFFKRIEQKTGVSMDQVFSIAQSFQHANFQDEQTVRTLIGKMSSLTSKPIPKELEQKIVETITAKGTSIDYSTLADMLNKTKKN